VLFAPAVVSSVKFVQVVPKQRSMRKPVSLFELSVHFRSMRPRLPVEAVRLHGATVRVGPLTVIDALRGALARRQPSRGEVGGVRRAAH
jgi:hypothetical protein